VDSLPVFKPRFQAGGLTEFSRWLSEDWRATPPECVAQENSILKGCQMACHLKSGTPLGYSVYYHNTFRWYRSLRDLNHRL